MVSPSRSISGFCQKQTKQQWPKSTCSCSHVWGVKQGPALQGPAKFPSSLMGNSIACLVPEQETKPIQTDEGTRHIGSVSPCESKYCYWRERERVCYIHFRTPCLQINKAESVFKETLFHWQYVINTDDRHQSTVISVQRSQSLHQKWNLWSALRPYQWCVCLCALLPL